MRNRAALCVVLLLAGCGGNFYMQGSSGGSPSGGSVNVYGFSTLGALFAIGVLSGSRSLPAPELDPARRVVEQDCTKPIEDSSANLKCR